MREDGSFMGQTMGERAGLGFAASYLFLIDFLKFNNLYQNSVYFEFIFRFELVFQCTSFNIVKLNRQNSGPIVDRQAMSRSELGRHTATQRYEKIDDSPPKKPSFRDRARGKKK